MGKRRLNKGQWVFWVIALFGWLAPSGVLATSENLLTNGNFSADDGGWTGANGGASCSGGSPSLGVWGGGPQLTFSYVQNSVTQQVSIASPSALELSFLANGPSGGTYSATISDSDQSVTTGALTAGENQVSNLGITTTQNDEVVTITFAGKDSLFWAGCYGPVIRNASLVATPTIPQGSYSGGGCGPYSPIYVIGTTGGGGWGSGPFTDDSNFGAAAVFAGLIEPGENAWLEPYNVNRHPSYTGGINNGVTMSDWGGEWCGFDIKIFGSSSTTTTTTTTLPPYFNAVENLTAVANENGSVDLDWDAPTSSNVDIYAYGVSFYDLDEIGGTTSGGWGVWTNQGTTYSLSTGMFSGSNPVTTGYGPVRFGIKAGNQSCFSNEGVGPCVYGPEITVDATVLDPTPPTTTTTITPEPEPTDPPDTTQPEPEPTDPPDTTEPEPEPTLPPDTIPEETDTTDGGPDGGTGSSTDTTSPETTVPESAPEEETPDTTPDVPVEEETSEQVVDDILADDPSPEELGDAVGDALAATESEEELVSVATELLTSDLDPEQFAAVIDEVFSQDLSDEALAELVTTVFEQDLSDEEIAAVVDQVFTADISDEAFAEVLDTVFEEPLSDDAFTSVIDAILDEPISDEAFDALVDVLGSDTVSDEQVVAAVDSIIENGLSEEQSISIATSGEVLESITGDQASEIFATVPIGDISDAEAAALVEAVQDAPVEVKESFETEINIFAAGNVDTYVPLGSEVPVGTRRVIIAAAAVVVAVAPVPVSRKGR